MPKNTIGLAEAVQLVDSNQFDDPRIAEFMDRIDEVATEILKCKKGDTEYMMGAIAVIQSNVLTVLLTEGYVDFPEFISLMYDKQFAYIIALAFKMSVGLAALEELR